MIDALRRLLRAPSAASADPAADLAVAVLLVEAARADGHYDDAERDAVAALLAGMFDLSPAAARALRTRGEAEQAGAPDLVRYTRVIKSALDEDQRRALIEGLWQIVLIDHQRDPHEDALLRHLAPLLALSDRDSAMARQRVLARSGPPAD